MEQKKEENDKTQETTNRKLYESPKLVEYGNVVEITQAMVMGSFADAQQMQMMMPGMMT